MKAPSLPWMLTAVLAGAGLLCWIAPSSFLSAVSRPASHFVERGDLHRDRHYVTPAQLTASSESTEQLITPLHAVTHEGRSVSWEDLSRGRPVVFVFIKAGCPCSVQFQPFFTQVERAYRNRVQFVGVMDGSIATARHFVETNHVSYPILADSEHALIKKFKASHSAYVALVNSAGGLDTLWPGCSAEMMHNLSRRIALLIGQVEQPLDDTGMPGPLTTGCPFSE